VAVERRPWQRFRVRRGRPADALPRAETGRAEAFWTEPVARDRTAGTGLSGTRPAPWAGRRRHAFSSLASSSAATDGGSLANSGVGWVSLVPGLIGADSQRAAVR
jgi:hypothetical protein